MRVYAVLPWNNAGTDDTSPLRDCLYPWALVSFGSPKDPRASLALTPEEKMRIYAVMSNNPADNGCLAEDTYPWVLASFKATQDPHDIAYRPRLLLDSGAFTVWTLGKTVDRDELVVWAKAIVEFYAPAEVRLINLDVIPGTLTRLPTEKERVKAAKESAANAAEIRAEGIPVIEVFHRYEPLSFLDGVLERRRPGELISIGGLVGRADPRGKVAFCQAVWKRIFDHYGSWDGIAPVHGLGISGDAPLAKAFPWFSVDSSTWFTMRNYNLHVTAAGKFKPRNRDTTPRTTIELTKVNAGRRLRCWRRQAEQLTRMWEERGVRYLDHPDGVL